MSSSSRSCLKRKSHNNNNNKPVNLKKGKKKKVRIDDKLSIFKLPEVSEIDDDSDDSDASTIVLLECDEELPFGVKISDIIDEDNEIGVAPTESSTLYLPDLESYTLVVRYSSSPEKFQLIYLPNSLLGENHETILGRLLKENQCKYLFSTGSELDFLCGLIPSDQFNNDDSFFKDIKFDDYGSWKKYLYDPRKQKIEGTVSRTFVYQAS